jgi:PqqD family protein of HPr-rel-A system
MSRRFELMPGVKVSVFGDEAVVFNPFSWETHVLNAAATIVLELVQAGCTAQEAAQILDEVLAEDERASAREYANRLLDDLASLRLIVPAGGE